MTTATKTRDRKIAENRARYAEIQERFDARIAAQDPNDPLTHDRMWNPRHADYYENATGTVVGVSGDLVEFKNTATTVERMKTRNRSASRPTGASTKQRAYLSSLLDRTRFVDHPLIVELREAIATGAEISKSDASEAIDAMKDEPRSNKYAGECGICGVRIEAEAGGIHKISGRWQVRHLTAGECETAKTEAAETPVVEKPSTGLDLTGLRTGRYADPDGDGRLKLKIDVVVKGKWNGYVFVKDAAEYGVGNRYGRQAPGESYIGDVVETLERIVANPVAAMARYGQLTGTCGACGRHLEDEDSIRKGIGPVCEKNWEG